MFNLNTTAMFYYERVRSTKYALRKCFNLILLGILAIGLALACQKDVAPDPESEPDPDQQEDPISMDDPDTLSGYLVVTGAHKINGPLPQASDGQLKINVQDTAYTINGFPVGAPRILINKPISLEITSFNVQVGGASFYYNIPAEKLKGEVPMMADSLRVLVLDVQPPDEIVLPLILDVTIQALDDSGEPIDEFVKVITVEDPTNPSCSPMEVEPCAGMHPFDCGGFPNWAWDHSIQEYDGYIYTPGFFRYSPTWFLEGCCTNQGSSILAATNPNCNENITNGEFKRVEVNNTGHSRDADFLYLYDNGTYYRRHMSRLSNVDAGSADFCGELLPYIYTEYDAFSGGTHNISDGSSALVLTRDNTATYDTQYTMPHTGGALTYTCHKLIIESDDGEVKTTHVYNRSIGIAYRLNQPKFWD